MAGGRGRGFPVVSCHNAIMARSRGCLGARLSESSAGKAFVLFIGSSRDLPEARKCIRHASAKTRSVHPIRFVLRAFGAVALSTLVVTSLPHVAVEAAPAGPAANAAVLDPGDLDPTCKACDDFYQFATGAG